MHLSKTSNTQLYNTALKQQALNPVGLNKVINITHSFEGYNASCGDEITIYLDLNDKNKQIKDISFETESCAICRASASLLCQSVTGLSKEKIISITMLLENHLRKNIVSSNGNADTHNDNNEITKLNLDLLTPVSQFPSRVNCAMLPWETLISAFD